MEMARPVTGRLVACHPLAIGAPSSASPSELEAPTPPDIASTATAVAFPEWDMAKTRMDQVQSADIDKPEFGIQKCR